MLKAPEIQPKTAKLLALLGFLLILAVFLGYSYRLIERTSFEIDGQRYYALFDDAMISMQYARNLAEGNGLVWNAGGERVEGFSNPLWVFFMALLHLLPVSSSQISLWVQISGAGFLLANLVVVWRLASEYLDGLWPPLLAVFLTAFYFHLNNWSLQGMEVGLLALLLSASAWLALRAWRTKRFSVWPYALLTVGTLVRIDMVVPLVALTAFFAWKDEKNRRRHLGWGLGLLAGSLIVQTGLRLWYYGEWLPNTYYLKVIGIPLADRVQRGLSVFGDFVWGSGWFLIVLPLLLLVLWPEPPTLLFFALLLGQIAYSIFVGGDAWEHKGGANRFIALAMPLFFLLFVQTLDKVRRALLQKKRGEWTQLLGHAVLAALVLTSLFSLNIINENDAVAKWTTLKRPPFVAGTQRYVTLGLLIQEITDPQARIAVATAGNIIYFAERTGIDMLGKSDKVIARSQPHESSGSFNNVDEIFRPGHNKWDYQRSIVELAPDIVAQIWGSSREMAPYLEAGGYEYFEIDGFPLYIRVDSEYVLWDLVNSRLTPASE
ncbi:MAG: glycosyltransferase family 39 protein [Anaerolineales bacterium]